MVFKYLVDKYVFRIFYATKLYKRLIHCESVSEEAEINMIWKLKEACRFEYTPKLQRILIGTQREQVSTPAIDVFKFPL